MAKVNVKEPGASPLYKELIEHMGEITEDWTKFLVHKDGVAFRRFS